MQENVNVLNRQYFIVKTLPRNCPFFPRQLPVAAFRSGHFEGREGGSKELMGPFGTR